MLLAIVFGFAALVIVLLAILGAFWVERTGGGRCTPPAFWDLGPHSFFDRRLDKLKSRSGR